MLLFVVDGNEDNGVDGNIGEEGVQFENFLLEYVVIKFITVVKVIFFIIKVRY